MRDDKHKIIGLLGVSTDITELVQVKETLKNWRYFIETLKKSWLSYQRRKEKFSLVVFDIDFFKKVNDQFGHPKGDQVIKHVADQAYKSLRNIDTLCRIGGEEFAIILPNTTEHHAIKLSERVRRSVSKPMFNSNPNKDNTISVTVSLGVSEVMDADLGIDSIMLRADTNLYSAKNSGRNCVRSTELTPFCPSIV